MPVLRVDVDERQIVLRTEGALCATTQELVESEAFARVVELYVARLEARDPRALDDGHGWARSVTAYIADIRGCPPGEGVDAVLVPGDPERARRAERLRRSAPGMQP